MNDKRKCIFKHILRKNIYTNFIPQLTIENMRLKLNNCPKLLGVYFDKKLCWRTHVGYAVDQ